MKFIKRNPVLIAVITFIVLIAAVTPFRWKQISDVTTTLTEVNKLHGVPAGLTATEIGYSDGLNGPVQPQLDASVKIVNGESANIFGPSWSETDSINQYVPIAASSLTYGNLYLNTADNKLYYKSNGTWYKFTSQQSVSSLADNLIFALELDETSGTSAADYTTAHNATLYGDATANATGKIGKGVATTATGYISIPTSTAFNVQDFSISMWYYANTGTNKVLISRGAPDTWNVGYSIKLNEYNTLYPNFGGLTPTEFYSTAPVTSSAWHHVVITKVGTAVKMYIDGTLNNSGTLTGTIASSTQAIDIGSFIDGGTRSGFVTGIFDQVCMWSRAITAGEVSAIFNSGNGLAVTAWTSLPYSYSRSEDDALLALKANLIKRTPAISQSATPVINTDITDVAHITGLAQAITSMTTNLTGTPAEGDELRIDFTDNGTARAIAWGTKFEASTVALPTTTVISTRLDCFFVWNSVTSKWRIIKVS